MKLTLDRFAGIGHAEIRLDGLTVIAGQNNTGKSTVGKSLYSLFNALNNIQSRLLQQRREEIEEQSMSALRAYLGAVRSKRGRYPNVYEIGAYIDYVIAQYRNGTYSEHDPKREQYRSRITEELLRVADQEIGQNADQGAVADVPEALSEFVNQLFSDIDEILNYPEDELVKTVLSDYFGDMFHNQVTPLSGDGQRTSVNLDIKNKHIDITFSNNECSTAVRDIDIEHDAIYIANPFIIDTLSKQFYVGQLDIVEQNLRNKLLDQSGRPANTEDGLGTNMIRRTIARDKLADIEQLIDGVIPGSIQNRADGYYLNSPKAGGSIKFENMSTGLKSFAVLKMLIEHGKFGERDVLILDEPEIHLHPEWQMKYAEVIVLLQKTFDLTVVVTTHSPYFLDAFNLYSRKYGTSSAASYYVSRRDASNVIAFEDVTDGIDAIYRMMAGPIDVLNDLRDELEERGA